MIQIKENKECMGTIYPDNDFLDNYEEYDYASFISTLQIEAMIDMKQRRLGDSDVFITILSTGNIGEKGLEEFKQAAKDLINLSKKAIESMSDKYAKFYKYFIDDFEKNGLYMPLEGKIL